MTKPKKLSGEELERILATDPIYSGSCNMTPEINKLRDHIQAITKEQDQYEEWWRECSKQRQALADRYDKLEQRRDELREMLKRVLPHINRLIGSTIEPLPIWYEAKALLENSEEMKLANDSRKLMEEK